MSGIGGTSARAYGQVFDPPPPPCLAERDSEVPGLLQQINACPKFGATGAAVGEVLGEMGGEAVGARQIEGTSWPGTRLARVQCCGYWLRRSGGRPAGSRDHGDAQVRACMPGTAAST